MIEVENLYPETSKPMGAIQEEVEEPEVYIEDEYSKTARPSPLLRLKLKDDRHYGNCIPLLYYRGEPLVIIGPDCKIR